MGFDLSDDVVMVLDREGVTNMFGGNIRWLIRSACRDSIAIYLIADNEAKWDEELRKIRNEFDGPFGCRIWKASFEEDNFGRARVIGLINSYLSVHEQSLSDGECRPDSGTRRGWLKRPRTHITKSMINSCFLP